MPFTVCFGQTIWYEGYEISNAQQHMRRPLYFGLDVGTVISENILETNEHGGLRPLRLEEKFTGTFYLKLGLRKDKSNYEIDFGFLQNQFRLQTPRGIGETLTKDYYYGSIKYYYLLFPKSKNVTFYIGGGLNVSYLTKNQNTFPDGSSVTWITQIENCPSCPPDIFSYKWLPIKSRKKNFVGLEGNIKIDFRILRRINFSVWNRIYLWNEREVLKGEVITKDNNQQEKTSIVNSLMPIHGFGVGISWNLGKEEKFSVIVKEK
jgi:hypothetical protein